MAGPRNTSPMEAMPGADVDRETPVRESGERVRERVLDNGEAEREVGEEGRRTIEEAKEVVTETSGETKGVSTEIQERYQEPMDGKENAGLAGIDVKLAIAEQKLEQEVTAAMAEAAPANRREVVADGRTVVVEGIASDVQGMEMQLRDIDRQLEEAHKKGDGNKLRDLETIRTQIDDARKKAMAERPVAKPAEAAPEAAAPAAAQEAAPASAPERDSAVAQKIEAMRQQKEVNLKNTGLSESMAAKINAGIDRDIAELEAQGAPAAEAAPVVDEGPEITVRDATLEEEAEVLEAAAETPKLALEARMRGIEARIKDEKTSDAEKAQLKRELEDATLEWQAAAAAEGKQHEVVRPRDPADVRPEMPKGEAANDNAVAAETAAGGAAAAEVAVGAAAAVEAATEEKSDKEKKKGKKKESDDDDEGALGMDAEKAATAEYKTLSKEMTQASQARLEVASQRADLLEKMKKEGKDYSDEVGGPLGHGAASVWEKADKVGLTEFAKVAQAFVNATGEMVGGKTGDLKFVEKMDDLSKRKKSHDVKMEGLREKKGELSRRESKLADDLAILSKKMADLAGSSLDSPAWAEARAQQAALKKEQASIEADKAAAAEAEQELKDEVEKLEAEEKKVQAEKEQASQAADREAIVPPAPVKSEKPPEPEPPDEGPPEPPAAGTPPESAPPAAPAETKLAA